MLVIDSNQVKIVELETEIQHLQDQQEKVTAELRVKFTPKNFIYSQWTSPSYLNPLCF